MCPTGLNLAEVCLLQGDLWVHPGRAHGWGTLLWGSRGPPSEEGESAARGGRQGVKRARLPSAAWGLGPIGRAAGAVAAICRWLPKHRTCGAKEMYDSTRMAQQSLFADPDTGSVPVPNIALKVCGQQCPAIL